MKTKIEIEVDIPAGHEFERFGKASDGDLYSDNGMDVLKWTCLGDSVINYIIVRKKEPRTWWLDVDACGRVNQAYNEKPHVGAFCCGITKVQEVIE